jgi:hypothetical protein
MENRKPLLAAVLIPLVIGVIGISQLASQPRFAAFRNVDILQLIGSGMCFGVALFALIALVRGSKSNW